MLIRSIKTTCSYQRLARLASTPEELFRSLWQPPTDVVYAQFLSALSDLHAETHNGFVVFTAEDRTLAEERRRAIVPTELMLRRAKRAVRLVRFVPFLEAVFICNSVGSETARPESDIDWFVVTKPERIWFVRAMLNSILRIAGLRTYGNHEAGRMCLSFFVDSDHLDLAPLRVVSDDVHFAYWLHQMVPVYDPAGKWADFMQANVWAREYLPRLSGREERSVCNLVYRQYVKCFFEKILTGKLGTQLERFAEHFQRAKLKPSLVEKAERTDNGVVLSAGVLKFHEHDTRREIYEAWKKNVHDTV